MNIVIIIFVAYLVVGSSCGIKYMNAHHGNERYLSTLIYSYPEFRFLVVFKEIKKIRSIT